MPLLTLIKHSMPAIDPEQPAPEWHLSSEGKSRCHWLANELDRLDVSVLYSSIEHKARETADLVGSKLGIVPTSFDGLHENDRTGFPYLHDEGEWKRRFREYFKNPDQRLIGQESANEAVARFTKAISKIIDHHPNENIGVVAHGTVIALFSAKYNDVSPFEIWDSLNPLPAYLSFGIPSYEITATPKVFCG